MIPLDLEAGTALDVAHGRVTWPEVEADFGTHRAMKIWVWGQRIRSAIRRQEAWLLRQVTAENVTLDAPF